MTKKKKKVTSKKTATRKKAKASNPLAEVHEISHPVLEHKVTLLRDKKTPPREFRRLVQEISLIMAYESTRDLSQKTVEVMTPMEKNKGRLIKDEIIVVPILRAGLGMLDAFLEILPFASVGHIGIYRDKFIQNTVEYYFKLPPEMEKKKILVIDPMLASGDTAVAAINRLKEYEVGPIRFISLFAAPEGIKKLKKFHPDVDIYCSSIERKLNNKGYILPGVGDAGDRLFSTL